MAKKRKLRRPKPPAVVRAPRARNTRLVTEQRNTRLVTEQLRDQIFAGLGQIAERLVVMESRLNTLENKVETLQTPTMEEVQRLKATLLSLRTYGDQVEARISRIADKAGFIPSEYVGASTFTAWKGNFDQRLIDLERQVGKTNGEL